MSVNIDALPQGRACESCGQHQGDVYSFYFGKKISETSRRQGNRVVTTKSYNIAGKRDGAACITCVRRRRLTMTALFVLIVAACAGVGWLTYSQTDWSLGARGFPLVNMLVIFAAALGLLIGIAFLLENLFGNKAFHGDNLIMALKKSDLQKQGFDSFWNTKNYHRLRR